MSDPFAILLDSAIQRLDAHDELLASLATDVATLAARAASDELNGPWSWLLADGRRNPAEVIADLVKWLGRVYLWYPGTQLPSCWLWHPWAVEELWVLRCAHAEAFSEATRSVAKAADWHERLRPGVARRIGDAIGHCALAAHADTEHTPTWTPLVPLHEHADAMAQLWRHKVIPVPTDEQRTDAQTVQATRRTA